MAKWSKRTLKLKGDHRWTAKPGYKIFVADRGAVRLDFPQDWVVVPGDGSIKFHDKPPPDDDCTLQLSVMHLPEGVDWSGLPLAQLLTAVTGKDTRVIVSRGEVVAVRRPDATELAWIEVRFLDPNEGRMAHSRTCLARKAAIQPLLTFDFWADHARRLSTVWDEVLRSLRLGEYVDDPTRGIPRRK